MPTVNLRRSARNARRASMPPKRGLSLALIATLANMPILSGNRIAMRACLASTLVMRAPLTALNVQEDTLLTISLDKPSVLGAPWDSLLT